MKYRTLDEIVPEAKVVPAEPMTMRALRRQRLERLAMVLDGYEGSLQLMSRVEFLSKHERLLYRLDHSPLWIAYQDPVLREQGLAGDRMGDAIVFFDLTWSEAHHLFCDCHYTAGITSRTIADRMRSVAHQMTLRDAWDKLRTAFASRFWHGALPTASAARSPARWWRPVWRRPDWPSPTLTPCLRRSRSPVEPPPLWASRSAAGKRTLPPC